MPFSSSFGCIWPRWARIGSAFSPAAFCRLPSYASELLGISALLWVGRGYLVLPFRYSRLWQLRKSFDLLFISICLLVYCVFVVALLARQSLCGIVKALRYHTHSPPLLFHDTKSDSIRSSVISRSFDLPTTRQNSPSLPPHTPISPLSTAGLSVKASQNLSRHSAATSG